jgi:hypothetical protein
VSHTSGGRLSTQDDSILSELGMFPEESGTGSGVKHIEENHHDDDNGQPWQHVPWRFKIRNEHRNETQTEPVLFRYPVLIQDLLTGSDKYGDYGADTNTAIWGRPDNPSGKIVSLTRGAQPSSKTMYSVRIYVHCAYLCTYLRT